MADSWPRFRILASYRIESIGNDLLSEIRLIGAALAIAQLLITFSDSTNIELARLRKARINSVKKILIANSRFTGFYNDTRRYLINSK